MEVYKNLYRNVSLARKALKEQMNLDTGGPTNMCWPFLQSCVAGMEVDYSERSRVLNEPGTWLPYRQKTLMALGLEYAKISTDGINECSMLEEVFSQTAVPVSVVTAEGFRRASQTGSRHIFGIVADSRDARPKSFAIIDSLLPCGVYMGLSREFVENYVSSEFRTEHRRFLALPDASYKIYNKLVIAPGVYLETE